MRLTSTLLPLPSFATISLMRAGNWLLSIGTSAFLISNGTVMDTSVAAPLTVTGLDSSEQPVKSTAIRKVSTRARMPWVWNFSCDYLFSFDS